MKTKASLLCLFLLACTAVAGAADTQRHKYQIVGTLDRLDLAGGAVVIGDMLYRLGPNIVIRDPKGRIIEPRKLREGNKVAANRFRGASDRSSGQYIYEIRVFPDNFDLGKVAADDD
jgi:hypothetical protein